MQFFFKVLLIICLDSVVAPELAAVPCKDGCGLDLQKWVFVVVDRTSFRLHTC